MKLAIRHGPDGIPDELFKALEAELPEYTEYLRLIRARLVSCDSEAVNADTGLHTATAVAVFRSIGRGGRKSSGATRAMIAMMLWWHWVATIAASSIVLVILLGYHSSVINEEVEGARKKAHADIEGYSQAIAKVVRQEALASRESNAWRVPNKIHLRKLPAGTYQMVETNPAGESRWVTTEFVTDLPEWQPTPGK